MNLTTHNVTETLSLGRTLGAALPAGSVVGLIGPLGAGKTHLIKGIAAGLDVPDPDTVTSPTFTLINEYPGRHRLYHVDAYRLENPAQLESLGFDEICTAGQLVVIEWADRIAPLLDDYSPIMIYLEHAGPNHRKIRLQNLPDPLKNRL